jgi:hypothetical protein
VSWVDSRKFVVSQAKPRLVNSLTAHIRCNFSLVHFVFCLSKLLTTILC